VDLGVGGLLLGPVFASESHGHDTVDYFRVDPRLGDEDDLIGLCDACHRRGLRVLPDGVFNHVARSFPAFADVLARRAESRDAGWFRLSLELPGSPAGALGVVAGHQATVDARPTGLRVTLPPLGWTVLGAGLTLPVTSRRGR
jgi:cyclomaltodextrinase